MRVQQILSEKATHTIETIAPQLTLSSAANLLAQKRIGALVVIEEGRGIVGMISERDIVREIGLNGAEALSWPISKVMTQRVITCALEEDGAVVLEKMTLGRFRHMPVVEDGAIVGLISIGDVVKLRLSQLAMEKRSLEGMIMGF